MRGNKLKVWFVFALLVACGIGIVCTAAYTMTMKEDYWQAVKDRFTQDSLSIAPKRGNILSSDGKVMVMSVPEYKILMDYVAMDKDSAVRAEAQHWRDSALRVDIDSIATGLASIFPDKDAEWFRARIREGQRRRSRSWRLYPGLASYSQYLECKQLPLLRERPYKGGFHNEEITQRKKLYGSLASRTLGDYNGLNDIKSGLEWCYDTLLRGKSGYSHRSKVRNRWLEFVDVPPHNGQDIVSTIDVRIQDIAEKALLDQLTSDPYLSPTAEKAVAIVMEVPTGDIKALVSLTRTPTGFHEMLNDAINALWEPGSTFKTGSMMVAMEDGYITPETVMFCENGIYNMHGRNMKDHNYPKGYGDLTVTEIMEYSSNIGVSKIIDQYYHDQPEKYVQGLYKLGVGIKYDLPMGSDPRVRMPVKVGRQYTNWSNTALAWMSIGYEVQLTPLNTLTFYNAIANNGKMVRPRFVSKVMEKGEVVSEFPVEVIREKICSQQTLDNIHMILEKVVSEGLGRKAGNKNFKVSGKTGTAQVAEAGSYEGHKYMVSFCGYFPSEAPRYSCIVCIYKRGTPASGGSQCGPVFSRISQLVMNQGDGKGLPPSAASDSTSEFLPRLARGNMEETRTLLSLMNLPWQEGEEAGGLWGNVGMDSTGLGLRMEAEPTAVVEGYVPDVRGMGARDAVYALETAGLRVRLTGKGRVRQQSLSAGSAIRKGQTIEILLR